MPTAEGRVAQDEGTRHPACARIPMAHTQTHILLHDTNPLCSSPIEASSPEPVLNSPRCRRRELIPALSVPPFAHAPGP